MINFDIGMQSNHAYPMNVSGLKGTLLLWAIVAVIKLTSQDDDTVFHLHWLVHLRKVVEET